MRFETRFLGLVLLLGLVFTAGLTFLRLSEREQLQKVEQESETDKTAQLVRIVHLKGEQIQSFVRDYTYWDDMVHFAKTRDRVWAKLNLEASLKDFKLDAIWVLDPDLNLIYSCTEKTPQLLNDFPLQHPNLRSLGREFFGEARFIPTRLGLMEIRGASIHPTEDADRKTAPAGYLFAGRLWNPDYIRSQAELVGGQLALSSVRTEDRLEIKARNEGQIYYSMLLPGISGEPAVRLSGLSRSPIVEGYRERAQVLLFYALGFSVFLMAVLILCLDRWVRRPLARLSEALRSGDAAGIRNLGQERSEFGDLARVIDQFFAQRQDLVRTLDDAKRLAQEAQSASVAKSEFLANVSHEIRTPLNAIIGLTDLALDSPIPPEGRGHLTTVRQASRTLLHLINEILDLSRIEAGRLVLQPGPFALTGLVEQVVRLFDSAAARKNLALRYEIDPGLPGTLIGDYHRLAQVLTNLLGNAVKFSHRGEVLLAVQGRESTVNTWLVRFEVRDTGIGIPLDKQQEIWSPFTQADGSFTRKYGGVGLGLSISSMLVQLMGGRIDLESQVGTGSRFWFELELLVGPPEEILVTGEDLLRFPLAALPLEDTAIDQVQTGTPIAPPDTVSAGSPPLLEDGGSGRTARPLNLLLVEDNPINQRLVVHLLTRRGHTVTVAPNGQVAVDLVRDKVFDAVLMDIQMPEMDGLQATTLIREQEQGNGRHLPIIALTAHAFPQDRARCLAVGMDGFLAKPIQASELFAILEGLRPPASDLPPPVLS